MEFSHVPVMFRETMEYLRVIPDGVYVDGTLGGAGHSRGIAERLNENGRLIANDLDEEALAVGAERLKEYASKVTFVHDDYKNITYHLDELGIKEVDGILLDLGISSYQIDNPERGFSYTKDAPLDMRMNAEQELSAYDVINGYGEKELSDVFYLYGEERYSRRIAAEIVKRRKVKPIETTIELSELVASCYPKGYSDGHPAKRVFQAVRIEVNGELEGLSEALTGMARRLKKGGRMVVITFHSLEDRIVKNCFKELEKDCICDKRLPICVCGKKKEVKILTGKPIIARDEELKENRRAGSAKLRAIEKI